MTLRGLFRIGIGLVLGASVSGVALVSVDAASCPAPTSLGALIEAEATADHPLSEAYPNAVGFPYHEGGFACYGSRVIKFTAFRGAPDGLGGTSAFGIEPAWLAEPGRIWLTPNGDRKDDVYSGPFYWVAAPPDFEPEAARLHDRSVLVVGHFDDARASTCVVTSGDPPAAPSASTAIEICRTSFVITSMIAAPIPGTDTLAPIEPDQPKPGIALPLVAMTAFAWGLRRFRCVSRA